MLHFTTILLFDVLARGHHSSFACLLLLLSCTRLIHTLLFFTVAATTFEDCVAGEYFDEEATTCKTCAPGFASKSQSTSCVEVYISCAPGQYVEFSASPIYCTRAECLPCNLYDYYCPTGRGLYDPSKSNVYSDYMVPCPDGESRDIYGTSSALQCTSSQSGSDCPSGSFQPSFYYGCFAW